MPTAETLHCPNCGAAVSSDSSKCAYCNARLATVACPNCFGMMFVGEKFCSHCGAVAQRKEVPAGGMLCPKCSAGMNPVEVGKSHFFECSGCDGTWVDSTTLQQICDEKEQQAAIIGMPVDAPQPMHLDTNFRYIPCPICKELMNRVNFARISGIILDVCKDHGTFFDKDELRQLVDFIRAGGLDKARERLHADEEREHERRMAGGNAGIPDSMRSAVNEQWNNDTSGAGLGLQDFAHLLISLFK